MKKTKHLFIDTGAFYAKYVRSDQYHEKSLEGWERIIKEKIHPITTNFVLSEVITLFSYRFGHQSALQAAHEIYSSNFIEIQPMDRTLERNALMWFERYQDQKFSMVDACSFAFMEKHKIKETFSFDKHFAIAGFILW